LGEAGRIRAENHIRPRCAQCGDDVLGHIYLVPLTEADCERYRNIYDPGDLLCAWHRCDPAGDPADPDCRIEWSGRA
jgi:hypothetical protein